jgi:hypothetical protein
VSDPTPQSDALAEAADLIEAVLDGRLDAAGTRRLEQLVCDRDDVATMYLRYAHQECIIAAHVAARPADLLPDEPGHPAGPDALLGGESMVLPALRPSAGADEADAPGAVGAVAAGPTRWPFRARRGLIGVAAALLLGAVGLWAARQLTRGPATTDLTAAGPTRPAPATVAGGYQPVWEGPAAGLTPGSPVPAATELRLRSGLVELGFAGGARVTIEGPARFTADDAGRLSLAAGRLAAVVPPAAVGFAVRTPAATVVDLGTEFGVGVNPDGTAEVAVFTGRVRAGPTGGDGAGTTVPAPQVLTQGQAAKLSSAGVTLDPTGAQPQRFVRRIVGDAASLDVVDLLCGGDGTTARRGVGIDVTSGRAGRLEQVAIASGDGRYHRVPALPVVDGCFVPDGTRGPVRVDSAGGAFAFPPTKGVTFGLLWAGGPIPAPSNPPYDRPLLTTIGGVDYAAPGHGVLWMHSNRGLTLDLGAVRRLHPGRRPSAFGGTFGISYTPAAGPLGAELRADLFVIVDGRARFERRGLTRTGGAFTVAVPLSDEDRFLTIATTDGGDDIGADWVICGDPKLQLGGR